MAHNRILYNSYNNENKKAYIVKSSQYGEFSGSAYCNPEDKELENKWDGWKIAERRCDIDIQKEKSKDFQSRLKGMKHLQHILHEKFNDDKDYFTLGMVEVLDEVDHQVKIMERETKNQIALAHRFKNGLNEYIELLHKIRAETHAKFERAENKE